MGSCGGRIPERCLTENENHLPSFWRTWVPQTVIESRDVDGYSPAPWLPGQFREAQLCDPGKETKSKNRGFIELTAQGHHLSLWKEELASMLGEKHKVNTHLNAAQSISRKQMCYTYGDCDRYFSWCSDSHQCQRLTWEKLKIAPGENTLLIPRSRWQAHLLRHQKLQSGGKSSDCGENLQIQLQTYSASENVEGARPSAGVGCYLAWEIPCWKKTSTNVMNVGKCSMVASAL